MSPAEKEGGGTRSRQFAVSVLAMFSSLVRQMQPSPPRHAHDGRPWSHEPSPSPGPAGRAHAQTRRATADFTEADDDDDLSNDGHGIDPYQTDPVDEDGPSGLPILPLFSASYLGEAGQQTWRSA